MGWLQVNSLYSHHTFLRGSLINSFLDIKYVPLIAVSDLIVSIIMRDATQMYCIYILIILFSHNYSKEGIVLHLILSIHSNSFSPFLEGILDSFKGQPAPYMHS